MIWFGSDFLSWPLVVGREACSFAAATGDATITLGARSLQAGHCIARAITGNN